MSADRHGKVVTFYSYKGGVGRTMALANLAWILAANGKRVLVCDWDLESPGLHRFYQPFLDPDQVRTTDGVLDLIREFEWAAASGGQLDADWYASYARIQRYAFSLTWDFPDDGGLDIVTAGRADDQYALALGTLDWTALFNLGGADFFQALRADMRRNYDYTLIDSRTGLSDVAEVCTLLLPDLVVDCFTLTEQGIEGSARVARHITEADYADHPITVLPVPMRVDNAEKDRLDAGRTAARAAFAGLPAGMPDAQRRRYWAEVETPYISYYAYEETLAAFADEPGGRLSLLASYERLAAHLSDGAVTALPPLDERVRRTVLGQFRRPGTVREVSSAGGATFSPGRNLADLFDLRWSEAPDTGERLLRKTARVAEARGLVDAEVTAGRRLDALPLNLYPPQVCRLVDQASKPGTFVTTTYRGVPLNHMLDAPGGEALLGVLRDLLTAAAHLASAGLTHTAIVPDFVLWDGRHAQLVNLAYTVETGRPVPSSLGTAWLPPLGPTGSRTATESYTVYQIGMITYCLATRSGPVDAATVRNALAVGGNSALAALLDGVFADNPVQRPDIRTMLVRTERAQYEPAWKAFRQDTLAAAVEPWQRPAEPGPVRLEFRELIETKRQHRMRYRSRSETAWRWLRDLVDVIWYGTPTRIARAGLVAAMVVVTIAPPAAIVVLLANVLGGAR
jgi:MinD-like ATPase involved in chromosome partitioning or flagellar assembly